MIENRWENQPICPPEEKYDRKNGVFRYALEDGTKITAVSADTWEEYLKFLKDTSSDDSCIVSPELITYTNEDFDSLHENESLVNSRIESVLRFSTKRPHAMFVLGTPLFVDRSMPRNGALIIRNGEVIQVTNKRSGACASERENFEFIPEEPPLLIPGTKTALLICADLPTASMYAYPGENFERTLELSNRSHLVGKNVKMLNPEATSILLISCWGVGGLYVSDEMDEDLYYQYQLRNISWRLMRYSEIKEVVVVDRAPIDRGSNLVKRPYNGIISIKKPAL